MDLILTATERTMSVNLLTLTYTSIGRVIASLTNTVEASKVVRTQGCLIITVIHIKSTLVNVCDIIYNW